MKKYVLCDQNGTPFVEGDIPETKEYKKICKVEHGKIYVYLDENKIEITNTNIPDVFKIWSHIKDNKNVIKVSDNFIVRQCE